jgi:hypothetical protein
MTITWKGMSDTYPTFAPSPIPEPPPMYLSLSGLLLVAGTVFSKRRRGDNGHCAC